MTEFHNTDPAAFRGVWVFCEQRGGELNPTCFELLSEGRKLADDLGVELCGLLLGDGVVNQTIPLILCGEEDVEGNHGATIGRLDEKMLFYLASRGIPEEAARSLLARARIEAVVDLLPEALAEEAHKFMEAHTDEL